MNQHSEATGRTGGAHPQHLTPQVSPEAAALGPVSDAFDEAANEAACESSDVAGPASPGDPAAGPDGGQQGAAPAPEIQEPVDPEVVRQRQQLVLTHIVKIARESRSDSSKLKRFLRRYERSPGELDDIIQDAMLEATRCADRFQARSSVETWFFGIAANVARNHVARCAKRSSQMESLDESPHMMDSESVHRPRDLSADVSQQVAYRQLAGIVDLTLSGLSPDLRGTFDLACLQEESYRDVAEIQAIPIGTVRSRVNRVRTLLRSRLKHGFADYAT
ncbi:sigma-70 family RNA polymerase sigma factor [Mitsuaria sp. GD03876]|uniref:sigma-70 family RNA polymerase sigma factor n=1 Tax=Mitsuaria sp. GD03876 TaxID=2975399 RepID=UPI00244BD7A5|nr:sigma-70 family RNA polymerase sigma factor [Mitsuaria sp. GD03876]MDH0865342.1 sigma-70 family RNA polymerase sigma factor [Mitsuaria sp. GD03876]